MLTSQEGTKSGIEEEHLRGLVNCLREECPRLHLKGLMTMGQLHDVESFRSLFRLREELCDEFGLDK